MSRPSIGDRALRGTITVRLTRFELDRINARAIELQCSVSDLVRLAIYRHLKEIIQ